MQDKSAFVPFNYETANSIIVDVGRGLMHLNLGSYRTPNAISSFQDYQPTSTVRPSQDISLGAIGYHVGSINTYTYTWLTNGAISRDRGTGSGDMILMAKPTIAIPSGVTFSS